LLHDKVRQRREYAVKVEDELIITNTKLHALRETYGREEWFKDVAGVYAVAKKMMEHTLRMLATGRKSDFIKKRGPYKKKVKVAERISCTGLDNLMKEYIAGIHKILRVYKVVDGVPKLIERNSKPEIPIEDWVGRYEEANESDGTGLRKVLWVPVAVLKAVEETRDYAKDYRFVRKCNKLIGNKVAFCAQFDLTRKFTGVG
jgi:hypothetical protein